MANPTQITKTGDASGRGSVSGYKVNFPARMRTYTEAEINAAEQILSDPKQRILEELRVHSAEKLPLDGVRNLVQELTQAMSNQNHGPLPITNLEGLRPWAKQWLKEFASGLPPMDPSFGALELRPIPPFGRPEKE